MSRCENCQADIPDDVARCTDCGADASFSILSKRPDGVGYYYGFADGDFRQINIREEARGMWVVYVHGKKVGIANNKGLAEQVAISWVKANPDVAEKIRQS